MNKGLIIGFIILVAIVGFFYFLSSRPDSNSIEGKMMTKEEGESGSYQAYNASKLALADNGPLVLFFRASWCPTCRTLDEDIKANLSNISPGMTILDVDYDDSAELKKKYGVTYQHTLVQVDANGSKLKKWSGSPTLNALMAEVK